jgi:hypothetical protein
MKDLRKYGQTIWMPTLKDRHPSGDVSIIL